jgi:hypothetical protein
LFFGGIIYRTPEDIENTAVYMPASHDAQLMIQFFRISPFQILDATNAQIDQISSDTSSHAWNRLQILYRIVHKSSNPARRACLRAVQKTDSMVSPYLIRYSMPITWLCLFSSRSYDKILLRAGMRQRQPVCILCLTEYSQPASAVKYQCRFFDVSRKLPFH